MINSTTTGCRFKHFTPEMRGRLEQMYQEGTYSQVQMAEILGVSQSVVSRMVKCGRVRQKDYNSKYYTTYIAEVGSRVYQENRANCRAKSIYRYSQHFFSELEKALLTPTKGRIFSVDTFVHSYRRNIPLELVP